jgi:MFS transporter, putative metabolite:H+ symporter
MTTTAIGAEHVARIPARMERLPLTRYIWLLAFLAATAWFVESIDIGAMGVVLPALKKLWALAPSQVGLLAVASTIGIVVGLVPAGRIADHFGRKTLLVWGVVFYSGFTIAAAFSNGLGMLLALRFLSGLGMGAVIPLPYSIICEFVGRGRRTFFNGFVEAALSIGYFGAPLLGFVIFRFWHPEVAWRILFVVAGLPLVYAYFVARYMPESPRWLARAGRGAEADRVLTNIERIVEQQSGRPLGPVDEAMVVESQTHVPTWFVPWTPLFLRRTIVSMICAVGAFFMFYIVMIFFPTIFHDRGLAIAHSLLFTAIITGAAIPGKLLNGWLAERYGRKAMYLIFMGLAGVGCLFFLSALGSTTAMLAYACMMSFFGTGAFPALKIWYAEQYPTPVRGTGVSTVEMVARLLGGVVGAYTFPVIVANQGLGAAFYAVAGVTFFGVAVMAIFGHETRGKMLEHLEQELIELESAIAARSARPV